MAQLKTGSTVGGSGIVTKGDNQALHDTDALRISGSTVYLYKGDGTNESVTLPSSTPTTTQVGAATAGLAVYAVGTYILGLDEVFRTTNPGGTRAGSEIRPANAESRHYDDDSSTGILYAYGSGMSGTWRCMGYSIYTNISDNQYVYPTVWLRIS
jgi:hypothetical protein